MLAPGTETAKAEAPIEAPHSGLTLRYEQVRAQTEALAAPLSEAQANYQSMPDASPAKWHLAHTTWFFETFILAKYIEDYQPFHLEFAYLFNSYYNGIGEQYPRAKRGEITAPDVDAVLTYRAAVDRVMLSLLENMDDADFREATTLGLHHEQQHQELLLTDLKHGLYCVGDKAMYRAEHTENASLALECVFIAYEGGLVEIGHQGQDFAYDNEAPRHKHHLYPYRLASRPVTNAEYLAFIEDGGYDNPLLWLSDGWDWLQKAGAKAPLYWEQSEGSWQYFTLTGMQPIDQHAPVCHVNYYEADAFAQWAGKRLPTEAEWEHAASRSLTCGHFVEQGRFHPEAANGQGMLQLFGDVWEWTASAYAPYPGFKPFDGEACEYNGKFMCNQYVLRGGSCVTPESHIRASYRNFFQPYQQWQFSGIRLAEDGV